MYEYTYDNGGNIQSVKRNGSLEKAFTYDDVWSDLLTSYNGMVIQYDEIGNPTLYWDGSNLTWSNGRQLTSVSYGAYTIQYGYNADGLRTTKNDDGVITEYYWLDGVLLGEKTGNDYIIYLYDENGTPYGFINNNTYYYYIQNAQGDIVGILDANGNQIVQYNYSAWGEILSITGSQATTIGRKNPLRYRGYYYDTETGLYYLQSRYYDPYTCRFINADGVVAGVGGATLGYNMFAYCMNNPVNMTDDTGNWPKLVEKVASAVINGFKKVVNAIKNIGIVKHDVPVYNQGDLNLCWAYSQTMVESFQEGNVLTNEQADNRAREIAVSVYGEDDWNQGGWPTNLGKQVSIKNNLSLLLELKKGPIYGYYAGEDGAHLIVITGINIWEGTIYTNNPWGVSGVQTRKEFLYGFIDMPNNWNMPFVCGYRIK